MHWLSALTDSRYEDLKKERGAETDGEGEGEGSLNWIGLDWLGWDMYSFFFFFFFFFFFWGVRRRRIDWFWWIFGGSDGDGDGESMNEWMTGWMRIRIRILFFPRFPFFSFPHSPWVLFIRSHRERYFCFSFSCFTFEAGFGGSWRVKVCIINWLMGMVFNVPTLLYFILLFLYLTLPYLIWLIHICTHTRAVEGFSVHAGGEVGVGEGGVWVRGLSEPFLIFEILICLFGGYRGKSKWRIENNHCVLWHDRKPGWFGSLFLVSFYSR